MEKRKLVPLSDVLANKFQKQEIERRTSTFCDACIESRHGKDCQLRVSVEEFLADGNVGGAQDLPKMPNFIDSGCPYINEVEKRFKDFKSTL